jgi:hypothetical protein
MATYSISPIKDGKYKVIRKTRGAAATPISMDRAALESYLKDGHSDPGPLDVLASLDRGETVTVTMDD